MQMLGGRSGMGMPSEPSDRAPQRPASGNTPSGAGAQTGPGAQSSPSAPAGGDDFDDDIPF